MRVARRGRRLLGAAAVAAAALLATQALGACGANAGVCGRGARGMQRVVIPPGSTFRAAADSLARTGVVRNPALFRLYATIFRRDRAIMAGTYIFDCDDARWDLVLSRLAVGPAERSVTIPEGWTIAEIAPALGRAIGAPVDSVLAAARDTALRRELDVPTPDLEGYLFPDTYRFAVGTTAREAVTTMVRRFEQVWNPAWSDQLQRLAMSRHDVVTLASIIEKEARLAEERPVISGVYHNRLRDGMMLQADPTVQYAKGKHSARVLYRDLEVDSPYNTYRVKGLPPGPIASPGKASIEAALFPANVPYRYFVAHPDGHHEFRITFQEHTEARREIRAESARKQNGR
jgi:UPF0755 protein